MVPRLQFICKVPEKVAERGLVRVGGALQEDDRVRVRIEETVVESVHDVIQLEAGPSRW